MKMRVDGTAIWSDKRYWEMIIFRIYDLRIIVVNDALVALFQDNKPIGKTSSPNPRSWEGNDRKDLYDHFMYAHLGDNWFRARGMNRNDLKKELHKLLMHRAMKFMDAQLTREDDYDD